MSYYISPEQLKAMQKDNVVIVDVRFELNDVKAGRSHYLAGHIPGAVYLSLDEDLSGKVKEHGGRHPLPDIDQFAQTLGDVGIHYETTVVVYDQNNNMLASRLWWMLHSIGHQDVYVLDGGIKRWIDEGNRVTTAFPEINKKEFKPKMMGDMTVSMEQVKEKMKHKTAILLDSRSRERYLGKSEPIDKVAGHIPGAIHFYWQEVFSDNGLWKNIVELSEHFSSLPRDQEIIVSCGSGVSATPNIMALKMAGFKDVKLYPGSYSDWISYPENKIETRDESIWR